MSRLTNKKCYRYEDFIFSLRNKLITPNEIDNSIYKKLKILEDIEEELSCPLEVVFKTLKQMFVFHKENVKIELLGLHIKSNDLYLYGFNEITTQDVSLNFRDYKKTWWLSETKEE